MDITLVLAVYNKLELTKAFYFNLRKTYPNANLIISDGGSTDGTKEWLLSINDSELKITLSDNRLSFSDTYNNGIELVDTDKLVLVHNDMVIGKYFLENIERQLEENMVLSYTTIEPPIFAGHERPGKVIRDFGTTFENFDYKKFEEYVETHSNNCTLNDGAVFFMSGYKKMFLDVGLFDGKTFFPCFCEDDDFLIRASLKGYKLVTTNCAISYHFVSQTSRFSEEYKNDRQRIELNSNRNFVRKWGMPISSFVLYQYWKQPFNYSKSRVGLIYKFNNLNLLEFLEPFFDKIQCDFTPQNYIAIEQTKTEFNLTEKFSDTSDCDVILEITDNINRTDIDNLFLLRLVLTNYKMGRYNVGNFFIDINYK